MAQDAITCLIFIHFFWNFHNQRIIERSAHWRHKIMAPPIQDFTTLATFGTFCLCTVLVQVICHNNQHSESCNLGYSLVVYPICPRQMKSFNLFNFHFGHFSVFPVTFSTPVGALYSIPQKNAFKMIYYTWSSGLSLSFEKNMAFPSGRKGLIRKLISLRA